MRRKPSSLFVYRIGRELGSLAAALGGFDALVFTAGIGENAPEIRGQVCQQAAWLGMELDETANEGGGPCITKYRQQDVGVGYSDRRGSDGRVGIPGA